MQLHTASHLHTVGDRPDAHISVNRPVHHQPHNLYLGSGGAAKDERGLCTCKGAPRKTGYNHGVLNRPCQDAALYASKQFAHLSAPGTQAAKKLRDRGSSVIETLPSAIVAACPAGRRAVHSSLRWCSPLPTCSVPLWVWCFERPSRLPGRRSTFRHHMSGCRSRSPESTQTHTSQIQCTFHH